jgi:hypothetical protein
MVSVAIDPAIERGLGLVIGLIIALAFGGFGLFCLWMGLRGLRDDLRTWRTALASRRWTATTATIVTSGVRVEGTGRRISFLPAVTYQYQAGGQPRTGTRLGFVSWGFHRWGRDEAEKALRPYPPGATVPVYVDPARPDEATLEQRRPRGQVGGCLIMAVLVGVGVGLVAIGWTGLVDLARSVSGP